MTAPTEHIRKIAESIDEIQNALDIGWERRIQTIGFHTSLGSVNLLELYLHVTNRITAGKQVQHNWFKRPQPGQKLNAIIERKMPIVFPRQEEVYDLMYDIEDVRDTIIYGRCTKELVDRVILAFQRLRHIIEEELQEEGVSLDIEE